MLVVIVGKLIDKSDILNEFNQKYVYINIDFVLKLLVVLIVILSKLINNLILRMNFIRSI